MSSWTDLLNSSTKLLEEAAPSAGFPPLQRNLDQLETLSKKLMAKTLLNRAPQQSIATTRLLAREGLNTEQLARDLNSFELKTTFEDVFPAEETSIKDYLQQLIRRRTNRREAKPSVTILDKDPEEEEREELRELLNQVIPPSVATSLRSMAMVSYVPDTALDETHPDAENDQQEHRSSKSPLEVLTNGSQQAADNYHLPERIASPSSPLTAVVHPDAGPTSPTEQTEATSLKEQNAASPAVDVDVAEQHTSAPHSPVEERTVPDIGSPAPHVTKAVEPQTTVSSNLATLTTNSNPVAVATSTVSTAPSPSIHSVADKLKALMEPPALSAEAIRAKAFLANLDQVDLEAEGSEQALWDSIETLEPYAAPKELELLSQIEFLAAQIPSRLAGLKEQKITVREQQEAFSQLDQSFHSEHSHLTYHFNTAVVEADLKLSRLERQKAEIEADIEATRLARDEQLALANQQLNELQKRKAALDQASSKAKIAEGHLRLIHADLNQLKLELDVQGKLL